MTVRAAGSPASVGRTHERSRKALQWWPDAAMIAVFGVITGALALAPVRELDLGVRDLADAHRPYLADLIAQNLNRLGSGGVLTCLCLVLAALLGRRRRSWWPFAPVVGAIALTGVVVQPLKLFLDRAAPHAPIGDDLVVRLFGQPDGVSYPSGHAVNTVVWYAVLTLLLAPWLSRTAYTCLRLAPPLIVTFTGAYLGYHWLTDMLAGLALGVPLAHVLTRIPWPALPHPDS